MTQKKYKTKPSTYKLSVKDDTYYVIHLPEEDITRLAVYINTVAEHPVLLKDFQTRKMRIDKKNNLVHYESAFEFEYDKTAEMKFSLSAQTLKTLSVSQNKTNLFAASI